MRHVHARHVELHSEYHIRIAELGIVSPYSVFRMDASTAKDSFAYNVGFGIEGTLLADVILILACICLYLWGKNNREKS